VHPTGGSRRVFRQFAWLGVGSGKMTLSRPAHQRVTPAVSPLREIGALIMNVTLLFAELVIIGIQVSLWLFCLILNIFGYDWLQRLQSLGLNNWQNIIVTFLLSLSYVLGIIFDRLSDRVFSKWEKRVKGEVFPLPSIAVRFDLGKDNEYLNRQFEYMRSRMRIARASSINFGLTTIFVSLFILTRVQNLSRVEAWTYSSAIILLGALLTSAAIYAFDKSLRGFYRLLKVNYELHESKQPIKTKPNSIKVDRKRR
jgi:hypothetical protein